MNQDIVNKWVMYMLHGDTSLAIALLRYIDSLPGVQLESIPEYQEAKRIYNFLRKSPLYNAIHPPNYSLRSK